MIQKRYIYHYNLKRTIKQAFYIKFMVLTKLRDDSCILGRLNEIFYEYKWKNSSYYGYKQRTYN